MRSTCTRFLFSVGTLAVLTFALSAHASTITLLNTSSPGYPSYPASDATDTGSNYLVTDFAGYGTGNATHLDFSLTGGASEVNLYDRTTSGGNNNGYVGGTTDFTTSFSLIFSNNADFSSPIATETFSKTAPLNPTGPSDFFFSADFAPVDAQYVRYQVVAANGANPGLANIAFSNISAVPEPGSIALLGTAGLGLIGVARRRLAGK